MSGRTKQVGPECPEPYRFVVEHDGRKLAVTNMMDVYGDATNDPRRVHSIVAYDPRNVECPWAAIAPILPEELEPCPTAPVN